MSNRPLTLITVVILVLLCVFVAFQVAGCNTHEQFYGAAIDLGSRISARPLVSDGVFSNISATQNVTDTTHKEVYMTTPPPRFTYFLHVNWNSAMMAAVMDGVEDSGAVLVLQLYGHSKHTTALLRERHETRIPVALRHPISVQLTNIPTQKKFRITLDETPGTDIVFHYCKLHRGSDGATFPLFIDSFAIEKQITGKPSVGFTARCDPFALITEGNEPTYSNRGLRIGSEFRSCMVPHTAGVCAWFIDWRADASPADASPADASQPGRMRSGTRSMCIAITLPSTEQHAADTYDNRLTIKNDSATAAAIMSTENKCTFNLKVTDGAWCGGEVIYVPIAVNGFNLSALAENTSQFSIEHVSAPPFLTVLPLTGAIDRFDRLELEMRRGTGGNSSRVVLGPDMIVRRYDNGSTQNSLVDQLKEKSFYYNTNICDASYMQYNSSTFSVADTDLEKKEYGRLWSTADTKQPPVLGKGFVFKGAMQLTPGTLTQTSSLKFIMHLYYDTTKTLELIFEIRKDSVSVTTGFAHVNGGGMSETSSNRTALRLNGNASDLSWVFQVSEHGAIYFVVNKNDTEYGAEYSGLVQNLKNMYARSVTDAGRIYYGAASSISVLSNMEGKFDSRIITAYHSAPNPLLSGSTAQPMHASQAWTSHELLLVNPKILKHAITTTDTLVLGTDGGVDAAGKRRGGVHELSCHMAVSVLDLKKIVNNLGPAGVAVLFRAGDRISLHYKKAYGFYFCLDEVTVAVTLINGPLKIKDIYDENDPKKSEPYLLFSYTCHAGHHQVYFTGLHGKQSYGSARLKTPIRTAISSITLPSKGVFGTVLSMADVSSSNNPYFEGGIEGLLRKQTGIDARESGVGIAHSYSPASFKLRNINVGKNLMTSLRPIPFENGSLSVSGRCPSMKAFSAQNCKTAETLDGKTFYLGTKRTSGNEPPTCAIVDKCDGSILTEDATVTTENMYQSKEEKAMLSWMHYFR